MAIRTGLRRLHAVMLVLTGLWALVFLFAALSERHNLGVYAAIAAAPLAIYLACAWVVSGFLKDTAADVAPGADATSQRTARATTILPTPLAGPWARYLGRMLDLIIATLIVGVVVGVVVPSLFQASIFTGAGGDQLLNMALLPFALVVEAGLGAMFGNSPGKWLVGTRVTLVNGGGVEFFDLLNRNMGVWWWGLGLGFPIVALFTLLRSKAKLEKCELLSWDLNTNTRCCDIRVTPQRMWMASAVWLALIMLVVYLNSLPS